MKNVLGSIMKNWHKSFKRNALYYSLFLSPIFKPESYTEDHFFGSVTILDYMLKNRYEHKLKNQVYEDLAKKRILTNLSLKQKLYFKNRIIRYLYENRLQFQPRLQKTILEFGLKGDKDKNIYCLVSDLIVDLRVDIAHGKPRIDSPKTRGIYILTRIIALNLLLEELEIEGDQIVDTIINLNSPTFN